MPEALHPTARDLVRDQFDRLVSDGSEPIDEARTRSFIRQVSAIPLTPGAVQTLADEFAAHKSGFATPAALRLREFLDGRGGAGPVADPKIMQEHLHSRRVARYRPHPGRLFVHGVKADDIKQGAAGDCFFISVLAALALQRPEVVLSAIKSTTVREALAHRGVPERLKRHLQAGDPADPVYLVRFYQRDEKSGRFHEVWIPVDADLPVNNAGAMYATARNPEELWVPIMEKAYAAYRGSWDQIGHGGHEHTAMEHLTGRPARRYETDGFSLDRLWATLAQARRDKKLVTAGSVESEPGGTMARNGPANRECTNDDGLVSSHAYTVLEARETDDGERWVKLRNPWGDTEPVQDEPSNPGRTDHEDDGVFWMSLARLKQLFDEISIGG